MQLFADRHARIDTENAFKVGPHIAAVEATGRDVIKLNLGEPDFDVPRPVRDALVAALDDGQTHYCDPQGIPALREAVAEDVGHRRGLSLDPAQVVVFPGGKPPIGLAQQIYCNPGDEVVYPSPGFPIYESFIRYVEGVPVPVQLGPENGFSLDAAQLEPHLNERTRLIYLNFPSNPTGGVATADQMAEIAAVIRQSCHPNVRVYSDEIYEHILFDGAEHHSIASQPGMADRTIIASGFSKTFAWTGGRLGYAVMPSVEEAQAFRRLNINYFSCVPPYNQIAGVTALTDPAVWATVAGMVDTFQARRDRTLAAVNALPGVSCPKPGGAFYLFPDVGEAVARMGLVEAHAALDPALRADTSPSSLLQMFALYRHGVALLDRPSFGRIGSEGKHFLRLSIAAAQQTLDEGVARLGQAIEDRAGLQRFLAEGPLR